MRAQAGQRPLLVDLFAMVFGRREEVNVVIGPARDTPIHDDGLGRARMADVLSRLTDVWSVGTQTVALVGPGGGGGTRLPA